MSIIEKALAKQKLRAAEAMTESQKQPHDTLDDGMAAAHSAQPTAHAVESPISQAFLNSDKPEQVTPSAPSAPQIRLNQPNQVMKAHDIEVEQPAPKQANQAHSATELGSLEFDFPHLKQQGFLVDSNERSQTHEEFRFVKRRVLKTAFGPLKDTLTHSNLVLVTSTHSNEGKTYTAINLALSIAMEQEKTVLLVDADVLNPSICLALGVKVKLGLIDYLLSKTSSLQDIIYNTNIPNLRLMPAGAKHHLTSELLASERMESLANELADRYSDRVIIFDAPPLLGINETQALTSFVGQQLVVVEENKTPLHNLESAISLLNHERAIGLVLNKSVQSKNLYAGYGYQYAENQ